MRLAVSLPALLAALVAVLLLACSDESPQGIRSTQAADSASTTSPDSRHPSLASVSSAGPSVLEISLAHGEYVHLSVEQNGLDRVLTWFGPTGDRLLQVDSLTGTEGREEIHWVAATAGVYRAEATSGGGITQAAGIEAGIELALQRPPTEQDRQRAAAERALAEAHGLRRQDGGRETDRQAVRSYRRADSLWAGLPLPERRAETLFGLALVLRRLGEPEAALAAFVGSGSVSNDPGVRGDALHHAARIAEEMGELERAVELYEHTLEARRSVGDRLGEATASNNLGNLYYRLDRLDDARSLLEWAVSRWRELGDPVELANALQNLGRLARHLDDFERARECFEEALALARRSGDRRREAEAGSALGALWLDLGRLEEARNLLEAALPLYQAGTPGQAVTRVDLGVVYRRLGRLEDARRSYSQALALFRRLNDPQEEARTLHNLAALAWSSGDEGLALERCRQALAVFARTHDPPGRATTLLLQARVRRGQGDLLAAREDVYEALGEIERLRTLQTQSGTRSAFFATHQELYDFLIDLLMDLAGREPGTGWDSEALEVAERARARSLLDSLAAGEDGDPSAVELLERERPVHPLSAAEIRAEVEEGTLLLEYRLGTRRSFLWAVGSEGVHAFELPAGRSEIETVVREVHRLLPNSWAGRAFLPIRKRLDWLSRVLLEPAADLLQDRRLVFVSDGALQYLPFGLLSLPGHPEPVLSRHEVVELPSLSALAALRRRVAHRPPSPGGLWVLADPALGGRYPKLPYARQEADALLALVPRGDATRVQGIRASRQAVLEGDMGRHRFVHFATHGVFEAADPGNSKLVLAQVDEEGLATKAGVLRTADIYRLRLTADLVVLSACKSALGQEVRGEGMVGMTHGFLHAGAERVVVSLWNVPDRATAELMERFYRGMLHRGLSPAAALRAAQLEIRSQPGWQAPYYWAGFVLQGEWRSLRFPFSSTPG